MDRQASPVDICGRPRAPGGGAWHVCGEALAALVANLGGLLGFTREPAVMKKH